MTRPQYERGDICRLAINCDGIDRDKKPARLTYGALVIVTDYVETDEQWSPYPFRYTIQLLTEDGAWDRRGITSKDRLTGDLWPEPGVIQFSEADQASAARQGWNTFFPDCEEHDEFEIQAITGSEEDTVRPDAKVINDRFANDEVAWEFVWKGAVEHKDPLAIRALQFLYYRSPGEYKKIREHLTDMKLPPEPYTEP